MTGQTAIFCSKVFQIEIDRQSQSALQFLRDKSAWDEVVKSQAYIEDHLDEKISIEDV